MNRRIRKKITTTFLFVLCVFALSPLNVSATTLVSDNQFFTPPTNKPDKLPAEGGYIGTSELTDIGKLANQALGSDIGVWEQFVKSNTTDGDYESFSNNHLVGKLNEANNLRNDINNAKTTAEKNALIKEFESKYGIPYDSNNTPIGSIDYYITSDGVVLKRLPSSTKNFRYLDKIVFTFQRLDGPTNVRVDSAKTLQYLKQKNSSVFSKYGGKTPTISQSGNTVTIDFDGQLVGMHDFIRDTWVGTQNNFKPVMYATFPNKQGMYKITAKVYAGQYTEKSQHHLFTSKVYGLDQLCKYCHPAPKNARITTKNVTLRKKANSNSDSMGVLPKNTKLTYVSKGSNGYTKVKYGNKTGYVLTNGIKVDTTPTGKCDYREGGSRSSRIRGGIAYDNGSAKDFYALHTGYKYNSLYYESQGFNGQFVRSATTRKLGYIEYTYEYWPYKEEWQKVHNVAAERAQGIRSTNGYSKLVSRKINKVPDGVRDNILVATYEWRIGVMEKSTPIPGDDGKNAEIGSTLTK